MGDLDVYMLYIPINGTDKIYKIVQSRIYTQVYLLHENECIWHKYSECVKRKNEKVMIAWYMWIWYYVWYLLYGIK